MLRSLTQFLFTIVAVLFFTPLTYAVESGSASEPKNNEMLCMASDDLSDNRKIELMQASYFPLEDEDTVIRKMGTHIGIGAKIDANGNIFSVTSGTPAARANLPIDGRIVAVDGVSRQKPVLLIFPRQSAGMATSVQVSVLVLSLRMLM